MLRSLSPALLIQICAVLASYGAVFATARLGGPAAQGQFTALKSFVDMVNAMLLMGLPQAIVLVVNRGFVSVGALVPWLRGYSIAVLLVALGLTFGCAEYLGLAQNQSPLTVVAIAGAIWGFTSAAVTRGALLTRTDGLAFSLFTALPQVTLLAGVLGILWWQLNRFEWAYAFQGLTCLVVSHFVLGWLVRKDFDRPSSVPPLKLLFTENLHAFVQSMFYSGQLFLSVHQIRAASGTLEDVGQFGIICLPILALHALAGIIAPLLYNRWSKLDRPHPPRQVLREMLPLALGIQLVALALLIVLRPMVLLVFGHLFEPSVQPLIIVALAAFPVVMTRLLSSYLQTSFRAGVNSLSCLLRVVATACVLVLGPWLGADLLMSAAAAWTLAEWAALAFIFICLWQGFSDEYRK